MTHAGFANAESVQLLKANPKVIKHYQAGRFSIMSKPSRFLRIFAFGCTFPPSVPLFFYHYMFIWYSIYGSFHHPSRTFSIIFCIPHIISPLCERISKESSLVNPLRVKCNPLVGVNTSEVSSKTMNNENTAKKGNILTSYSSNQQCFDHILLLSHVYGTKQFWLLDSLSLTDILPFLSIMPLTPSVSVTLKQNVSLRRTHLMSMFHISSPHGIHHLKIRKMFS